MEISGLSQSGVRPDLEVDRAVLALGKPKQMQETQAEALIQLVSRRAEASAGGVGDGPTAWVVTSGTGRGSAA